jgi:hypothetical protein
MGAVLALGLAACARQGAAPDQTGAPAQAKPQQVTVTADDAGWKTVGTQDLRAGWVTFTFETREGEADHGMQLVRFKNGGTIEQLLEAEDEEFLEMAEPIGGFVGVTGAERHTLTIHLDAGSYGMIDFGGTDEGGPNFLRGMTASFEVAPGDGTIGSRPNSDGEIVMTEFAIDLPEGFTGQGTYLVRNAGALLHELNIGRLSPGADLEEEIRQHAETGRGRLTEVPGLAVISPGKEAYLELDLASGSYAFACFISMGSEPPHALQGMYAPVTVG